MKSSVEDHPGRRPWRAASTLALRSMAALPARSPTTGLSWASAILKVVWVMEAMVPRTMANCKCSL